MLASHCLLETLFVAWRGGSLPGEEVFCITQRTKRQEETSRSLPSKDGRLCMIAFSAEEEKAEDAESSEQSWLKRLGYTRRNLTPEGMMSLGTVC